LGSTFSLLPKTTAWKSTLSCEEFLPLGSNKRYNIWYMYREERFMDAITYTHARSNLATTMDQVCDDHSPVIITRKNRRNVVMISLEDYQSLEETA
jgi:prevent-host-death family protein